MKSSDQYKTELEELIATFELTDTQKYDIMWKAGMIQSCAKLEAMDRALEIFNIETEKQP